MDNPDLPSLLAIALFAGLAMPAGALLSFVKGFQMRWLQEELRHGILALGAGALISAVALVLVPQGIAQLDLFTACGCFLAGAVAFMALDIYLARHKTPASQLAAMVSDFVPESIALGATAALGGGTALLGILIFVQNLPEGFNAYREMKPANKAKRKRVVLLFTLMSLLGPLMSLLGYYFLAPYPQVLGAIMLFASGGILYCVLQDVAPQIPMKNHWLPPLGGIVGFLIGIIGLMVGHA